MAIDVEIASRSPIVVCALGAVRFEAHREAGSYRSLVQVRGPVHFTTIHRLQATDLRSAPPWPEVWRKLLEFVGDIRHLVAFRAAFDRGAILTMCAAHGLRVPSFRFTCAAEMAETRFARKLDLEEALRHLGLRIAGRLHDPLADARAAGAIAIACSTPPLAIRERA